ncbi:MAG: methylmalonate-semialdehyde dehydrogenase (CoA acylating), partial [Candidatus Eremiobacteraeota bacterium]|nr:methylmalonate-semialdehyde dehydrogenase (CoA acylating) [Candidatus Eremiobacteraeota bacterium]
MITATTTDAVSLRPIRHYVGGAYVDGTSGRFGDVYDPTLGTVAARVEFAGRADVEAAVANAAAAGASWA